MRIMVTGGSGFIGSALVRHLLRATDHHVLNFDKLTYAASPTSLNTVRNEGRYRFVRGDIRDEALLKSTIESFQPQIVTHLAAETHVDRSLDGPRAFVDTNIVGTFTLLSAMRDYWRTLDRPQSDEFRFHHISTDEVYGSLGTSGLFSEDTRYDPRSPYAASKAASDHLVSAWGHSYGLPVLVTNCSNNYGPCQFPEKLIPLTIARALSNQPIPVYGRGENIRDWLHVDDHVRALQMVFERGIVGRRYNIGGNAEVRNIDVVGLVCDVLDRLQARPDRASYRTQIAFVQDRPGHDYRYAIDSRRICEEIGWFPCETFASGIEKTVQWYLHNQDWWRSRDAGGAATQRRGLAC